MSYNDPIADMLTRIRNALMAGHKTVRMPASKVRKAIGQILVDEGYCASCEVVDGEKLPMIELGLKYLGYRQPVIEGIKRISKPGRRVYAGVDELPSVRRGLGIAIVSTSSGVLTSRVAREKNVGGEVLCEVW